MDASAMSQVIPVAALRNGSQNKLMPHDRAAHEWYRFVLSFPPHLVRQHLERFEIGPGNTVLDPFCGTGTTLVECKKRGISSLGIEAHPMARFASH
jgi:tRNA G10  N-methylase Trm11